MMTERNHRSTDSPVLIKLNDAAMEEDQWEPAFVDAGPEWTDNFLASSHVTPLTYSDPKMPESTHQKFTQYSANIDSSSNMSCDVSPLQRSFSLPFLDLIDPSYQDASSEGNLRQGVGIAGQGEEESWREWHVECPVDVPPSHSSSLPLPAVPLLKSFSSSQLLTGVTLQRQSPLPLHPPPGKETNGLVDTTDGVSAVFRQRAVPVNLFRWSETENTNAAESESALPSATAGAIFTNEKSNNAAVRQDLVVGSPPSTQLSSNCRVVERRKEKKSRTFRHSSALFSFGASRSKKSKEDIQKHRETHHFVSVSISTSAVCWICHKALAHKLTVKCQRCNLICHEVCLEQIEACSASLLAPSFLLKPNQKNHNRQSDDMGQRRRLNSTGHDLPVSTSHLVHDEPEPSTPNGHHSHSHSPVLMVESAADHVAMEYPALATLHPALPATPVKRLSVPAASALTKPPGLGAAQSECNLSPSSPSGGGGSSSLRRPISPSGFSRWRHVADKLLNKPSNAETLGGDSDSAAEDVSLSETVSHVGGHAGQNNTGGAKADSVAHLLPMLRFDADLKLELEEPEAWVSVVQPAVLLDLTEQEIKRQSMIHELIFLEKNYHIILLIIDQLYITGLRHELGWSDVDVRLFFPSFTDILAVHQTFLRRLRARQAQGVVIAQIGDVFLQQFEGDQAEKMKKAYGDFCCHKKQAEAEYKQRVKSDAKFAAFDKKWSEKIGNRNLRFDSVMQTITQRITKYRILVDNIFKKTDKMSPDYALMSRGCHYVDKVISHVNRELDQQKLKEELGRIYRLFDSKLTLVGREGTPFPQEEWKKHHLLGTRTERSLLFEPRQVHIQRSNKDEEKKALSIVLLVMSDVLVLLQGGSGNRERYSWANIDSKRDRAVIHLQDLVIRPKPEMAGVDERTLLLMSPELRCTYEVTGETAKDRDKLLKEIEAARDYKGDLRASSAIDGDDYADAAFLDNFAAHLTKIEQVFEACKEKDAAIVKLYQEKGDLLQVMASCVGVAHYRLQRPAMLDIDEKNLIQAGQDLLQTANRSLQQVDKLSWLLTGNPLQLGNTSLDQEEVQSQARPSSYTDIELELEEGTLSPEANNGHPRRADTFGGFDINKSDIQALSTTALRSISMKIPDRHRRTASHSNTSSLLSDQTPTNEVKSLLSIEHGSTGSRTSLSPSAPSSSRPSSSSSSPRLSTALSDDQATLLPPILQLAQYLTQLTAGLTQQNTVVEGLRHKYTAVQQKVTVLEARDKRINKHSGQLEELRALQETLAKEKIQYQVERDLERQALDTLRRQVETDMAKMKRERDDVERQRQAMFAQCEKLVENGLEVKLSSSAPYVQIFHRQQPSSNEGQPQAAADLQEARRASLLPPRPLSHHPHHHPAPPESRLMSPPPYNYDPSTHGPNGQPHALLKRPGLLLSSNSLSSLPIQPPTTSTPAVPKVSQMALGRQPSQQALLHPAANSAKQSFSWKGSMESLCDKLRNSRESVGLVSVDLVDSNGGLPPPPRSTQRANSEAKLGIGNLMHLSDKNHAKLTDHPASIKKKNK